MSSLLLERLAIIPIIYPVADYSAGTPTVDIVNMSNFECILFVSFAGVATGGTGASTFTVEASDDVSASNVSALTFYSREIAATDVESAITLRAATGYVGTAGSNNLSMCEIDARQLSASGYKYARVKLIESVNDPRVGCVFAIAEKKVARALTGTALT